MQQKISCWHEKQWSALYKTPSLTRWTGKNGTLKNMEEQKFCYFNFGDSVLISTVNLSKHVVTNVGNSKLLPKYIGPLRVLRRKGNAYKIELPRRIRTRPTFYVGRPRKRDRFLGRIQRPRSRTSKRFFWSRASFSIWLCREALWRRRLATSLRKT